MCSQREVNRAFVINTLLAAAGQPVTVSLEGACGFVLDDRPYYLKATKTEATGLPSITFQRDEVTQLERLNTSRQGLVVLMCGKNKGFCCVPYRAFRDLHCRRQQIWRSREGLADSAYEATFKVRMRKACRGLEVFTDTPGRKNREMPLLHPQRRLPLNALPPFALLD